MDSHKNFAYSTLATAPSGTGGTSLVVATGHGTRFPAVPFNATIWPSGVQPTATNAEIVRVTNIASDTFTITRAQESSTARTHAAGYQIAATITAKVLTDAEYGAHLIANVMDPEFGAVGDGIADDTAALQAAVDTGRTVLVPSGVTCKITSRVTVSTPMTIRVDGTLTTNRYDYEATPIAIFYVTADNVTIEGSGTLRGPGLFSHDTVADVLYIPSLIRVHSADYVTVRNLRFVDGPQTCIAYNGSHYLKLDGNIFEGGDSVANCVAEINYYAVHGINSDASVIVNNRFVDDASGNTFAEGIFIYNTDYTEIRGNYFKNIVDHDVYLYHSVGDIVGVNTHNVVVDNVSYTTLTNSTQKVGASFKMHGEYNVISDNHIVNTNSGIVLECGSYSVIANNTITGFETQGIIVTDLVSANAAGLNHIAISNNTLRGAAGVATSGIYYRGDPTNTTAHCVGGKILGNTVTRCGDAGGGAVSPIDIYHSQSPYYMESFIVADNVIVGQTGVYGMYLDRVRYSKFTQNIIRDGTYTAWRGFHFVGNSSFNEVADNVVRDDQNSPLLAIGCNFGGVTVTDTAISGNRFHSLYASRDTNPWRLDATYRNIGDRNTHGNTLGYPVALSTAEAVASITATATVTIAVAVPSGARLVGVQLRVETALAGGELWDAAYSGGSTTAIATAQAVAKNTKVNLLYNTNGATDITSNTTNVAITKNGGGSFTAQGAIRALVYYESLGALGDAP